MILFHFLFAFSLSMMNETNASMKNSRDINCFKAGCIDLKNDLDNSLMSFFSGKVFNGSYLVNSTSILANTTTLNYTSCLKKCSKRRRCFSLNYRHGSVCELLKENAYEHQINLTKDSKWMHISMKSTVCDTNPCLNQALCVPLYHLDSFKCACANGYDGKFCQNPTFIITPSLPDFVFDFNEGDTTNSGNNKNDLEMILDVGGQVVHVPDRLGQVLYCGGLKSCIELESINTPCLNLDMDKCSSGFMISFWVKFRRSDVKRLGSWPTMVMFAASGLLVEWHGYNNQLLIIYRGRKTYKNLWYKFSKAFKWNHIAICVDKDESLVKFFLNAVDMESQKKAIVLDSSAKQLKSITHNWFHYNGHRSRKLGSFFIDDIAFWRKFDTDLIKNHYYKSKQ